MHFFDATIPKLLRGDRSSADPSFIFKMMSNQSRYKEKSNEETKKWC